MLVTLGDSLKMTSTNDTSAFEVYQVFSDVTTLQTFAILISQKQLLSV